MPRTPALTRLLVSSIALTTFAAAQCPPPGGYPLPGGVENGPVSGPAGPVAPTPASPTTPRPASPAAPAPAGPSTPRPKPAISRPVTPRSPGAAPAGRPTTPRGMPISFQRGATSKQRLKIDWVHPVPPKRDSEHTAAAGSLPLNDALDILWADDDGRPLLVLRECRLCQGSDGALLSRSLKNDKTMLMTKWFRTVKLPAHVAENGHAFHNVFAGYGFEKGWPHFFLLADRDSKPVEFSGTQTQSQLWKAMYRVLEQRYAKNPQRQVKKWLKLLDRYDSIDSRRRALQEELLAVRAERGPNSSRAKKLVAKIAELDAERAKVEAEERKVRDLGLLQKPGKKVAANR